MFIVSKMLYRKSDARQDLKVVGSTMQRTTSEHVPPLPKNDEVKLLQHGYDSPEHVVHVHHARRRGQLPPMKTLGVQAGSVASFPVIEKVLQVWNGAPGLGRTCVEFVTKATEVDGRGVLKASYVTLRKFKKRSGVFCHTTSVQVSLLYLHQKYERNSSSSRSRNLR